jgi:hypothetical protein
LIFSKNEAILVELPLERHPKDAREDASSGQVLSGLNNYKKSSIKDRVLREEYGFNES